MKQRVLALVIRVIVVAITMAIVNVPFFYNQNIVVLILPTAIVVILNTWIDFLSDTYKEMAFFSVSLWGLVFVFSSNIITLIPLSFAICVDLIALEITEWSMFHGGLKHEYRHELAGYGDFPWETPKSEIAFWTF